MHKEENKSEVNQETTRWENANEHLCYNACNKEENSQALIVKRTVKCTRRNHGNYLKCYFPNKQIWKNQLSYNK
jgi:hypothetical protein